MWAEDEDTLAGNHVSYSNYDMSVAEDMKRHSGRVGPIGTLVRSLESGIYILPLGGLRFHDGDNTAT